MTSSIVRIQNTDASEQRDIEVESVVIEDDYIYIFLVDDTEIQFHKSLLAELINDD